MRVRRGEKKVLGSARRELRRVAGCERLTILRVQHAVDHTLRARVHREPTHAAVEDRRSDVRVVHAGLPIALEQFDTVLAHLLDLAFVRDQLVGVRDGRRLGLVLRECAGCVVFLAHQDRQAERQQAGRDGEDRQNPFHPESSICSIRNKKGCVKLKRDR